MARFVSAAAWLLAAASCAGSTRPSAEALDALPRRMLWAWERPEDFRTHFDDGIGVAYLAATIRLHANGVEWVPRRQPLRVRETTPIVAVVRVESHREWRPDLRETDLRDAITRIVDAAGAPRVRAVQVDFDARLSERDFYRRLLVRTREELPPHVPLTITALASWCAETWLDDLPIDEAVPMLFRMGREDRAFRALAENGRWGSRVCRGSIGLSTDEPQVAARGRRVYTFNPAGWTTP